LKSAFNYSALFMLSAEAVWVNFVAWMQDVLDEVVAPALCRSAHLRLYPERRPHPEFPVFEKSQLSFSLN